MALKEALFDRTKTNSKLDLVHYHKCLEVGCSSKKGFRKQCIVPFKVGTLSKSV